MRAGVREWPADRDVQFSTYSMGDSKAMDRVAPRLFRGVGCLGVRASKGRQSVHPPSEDQGALRVSKLVITNSSRQRQRCMSGASGMPPHPSGKVRTQVVDAGSSK